jgi:hypothetical protein
MLRSSDFDTPRRARAQRKRPARYIGSAPARRAQSRIELRLPHSFVVSTLPPLDFIPLPLLPSRLFRKCAAASGSSRIGLSSPFYQHWLARFALGSLLAQACVGLCTCLSARGAVARRRRDTADALFILIMPLRCLRVPAAESVGWPWVGPSDGSVACMSNPGRLLFFGMNACQQRGKQIQARWPGFTCFDCVRACGG